MPYGNQQGLIGEGMDTRLLQQDFSGYTNAASIQAAGMMNAANTVATKIEDYTKQQKEDKNRLKAGATLIDAAAKMFPSQAPALDGVAQQLKDENIPLSERAAIAAQVGDLINMGVGEGRYQQEYALKQQDQQNQNRESSMRQWSYGQEVTAANRKEQQYAIDTKTMEMLGDPLFEKVLGMAPPEMADRVRENSMGATAVEKYSLANSLMSLLPKQDDKAPTVQEFGVPGGKMSMQWNGSQWVPVQTAVSTAVFDASRLPSGLQPHAQEFAAAGAKYGVDPKILAAIAMHETGNGTSSAFKNKNNAMGVSDASGPVDTGTVGASIDKMARLLAAGVQGKGPYAGKKTIAEIAKVYAPEGAGNDPKNLNKFWTDGVEGNVTKLGGDPSAEITYTPPTPVGFTPTGADGAGALTEKQKYDIEKDKVADVSAQQNAVAKSQEFVNALTKLENHPGFSNLFGTNVGIPTWVAGTDGAGAKALFNQIEGKGFLESIQAMKGMGALSNAEGEKVSAAFLGITPAMKESEVKARITEIKSLIQTGMQRASTMTAPAATPTDPAKAAADRLRGYIPQR